MSNIDSKTEPDTHDQFKTRRLWICLLPRLAQIPAFFSSLLDASVETSIRERPAVTRCAVALASPARTSSTICSTGEIVGDHQRFGAAVAAVREQFAPRGGDQAGAAGGGQAKRAGDWMGHQCRPWLPL